MSGMLWVCAAICAVSLVLAWRFTARAATPEQAERSQSVHGK